MSGITDPDRQRDSTGLRYGYTTGSCAAAAAKAASEMLLGGDEISEVQLVTPSGVHLSLEMEDVTHHPDSVSCAVRKDSGDDPDVTNGTLVYADVSFSDGCGVTIDGGEGVGRVTKPGLDQPVGQAAINSTPRRMITREVRSVMERHRYPGGLAVTIRIPDGEALAKKTFNPKLGIVGGISVLGTTGIVKPMSEQAVRDTIRTEISVRKAEGYTILAAAPGNYGLSFLRDAYHFPETLPVTASNFLYDTARMVREAGFRRCLFAGHIGKLVKAAGGIRNTHSRYGDRRMEILWQFSRPYLTEMPGEGCREQLMACATTDDAIRHLDEWGIRDKVMRDLGTGLKRVFEDWTDGAVRFEVIVFSNVYGILAKSEGADDAARDVVREWRRIEHV